MNDNNHGGVRPNSGRKSKAEEMGLPKLIEDIVGDKGKRALIQKLYDRSVTKGDIKAITLLMAYIFGKPSDSGMLPIDADNVESVTITYVKPDGNKG